MKIKFNKKYSFIIRKIFLGSVLTLLSLNFINAQEFPCRNLRNGKTEFSKIEKKIFGRSCQNVQNETVKNKNRIGEISISGNVTHQNGVRMSGITMTLRDLNAQTSRIVITDEMGLYRFDNIEFGARVELTPSLDGYNFFPPMITWEGIVESQVENFIAVGPPPEEPPPPPGTPLVGWSSFYNSPENSSDYRAMFGRDALGNIYLGGTSANGDDSGTDIALSKLDSNGNFIWSRRFNGASNFNDGLVEIVVDGEGNVYLAGFSYTIPESGTLNSYDYLVIKYDTNGNLLWSKTYGRANGFDDFPAALKIDSGGNVYVTGFSWDLNVFADYATIKYDSAGNEMWIRRFSTAFGEAANDVEIDSAGNVYVTGLAQNGVQGGSEDIFTIKYDSNGQEIWQNRYNSPSDDEDEGFDIEIDSTGNLIIMGESYVDFQAETVLQKINSTTGNNIWVRHYRVPNSFGGSVPNMMRLDNEDKIIVTGITDLSDGFYEIDVFTTKFDTNGDVLWLKTFDGPADDDYDGDGKLAIDADGNVYVGFTSEGFANPEMRVIKYSSAGDLVWQYRYGSPYFEYDGFTDFRVSSSKNCLLVDDDGSVIAAGESDIPGQGRDLIMLKLIPESQSKAVSFDFDGDKKADIAVFRPETGVWYVLNSSNGSFSIVKWGLSTDKPVPADYDGDGKNDLAVYRNGVWYIRKSTDSGNIITQFGLPNDIPVPLDFDNDRKADLSVFRQGIWHQLNSSDNSYKSYQFGLSSDKPIPSDYDKNSRSDAAVFRNGNWFVSYQAELPLNHFQFGLGTDKPVPADYDGDRQTDFAVFRNGIWYIRMSRTEVYKTISWGLNSDIPVPADYDGDNKADVAVYRNGVWYILKSSDNNYSIIQFGLTNDIPIPSVYLR